MDFEWDEAKARSNHAKHGVSFEAVRVLWQDPHLRLALADGSSSEERWTVIGYVGGHVLKRGHHLPEPANSDRVRIVSLRRATPHERKSYEDDTD